MVSAEILVGVTWVIILRYSCTFTVDDLLTAATKDPTSCVAINGNAKVLLHEAWIDR